jgi:methyl-accepting chemotaxis protein WspA
MTVRAFYLRDKINATVLEQVRELNERNLKETALSVYNMCKIANELLLEQLSDNVAVMNKVVADAGGLKTLPLELVDWKAKNQSTGEEIAVRLPKLCAGDQWLGKNFSAATPQPLTDMVGKLTGEKCTILQRINERGDMLRVASGVVNDNGDRIISSYIPAVDKDGIQNTMIKEILSGKQYIGRIQVLNASYLACYEPMKDASGVVIGCAFLGVKLSAIESVKSVISGIKIGKNGYVGVVTGGKQYRCQCDSCKNLASNSQKDQAAKNNTDTGKGTYVISQDNKRDGENILDTKDADGNYFVREMIERAVAQKQGAVGMRSYLWRNASDPAARLKTAAFVYFEPWDWVIFPGLYDDDFKEAQQKVVLCLDDMLSSALLINAAIFLFALAFALYAGRKIANPIAKITDIAKKIAQGNLFEADNDIKAYRGKRKSSSTNRDETLALLESFAVMTNMLNSLVGKVQQSTIQLFSTATEIAASSKQQEATVKQFSASTNEIVASSKEISATSKQLLSTIVEVREVSTHTADNADSGQNGLVQMQSTMKHLASATDSVSSKLSIINEKANNINDVVVTITKVADQTNLLSLNAAIEAEKAGEYGLGFAVVAREIRRLADQTAVATLDIIKMVKEMQSSVSSGVMEMDKFADEVRHCVTDVKNISGNLENIIQQVQGLPPKFDLVADGMQGQHEGAQQITEAMIQLNEAAQQTSESLREFNQVTAQLDKASRTLQEELSIFKVS